MGRKLPWASSDLTAPKTIKGEKLKIEPAIKDESKSFPSPRKYKRPRNERSPSTSPPPALPVMAFMREGIDGDDVYMMVEDEFQTVAQSFTAHLHMAEYQRLKQEAKMRQNERANAVVPATASFEVKYKHVRKDLEARQESYLKDVAEQEEQVEEIVEPWAGTSLAGLMKWDGSQKTSLKGLDRLTSGSRAAKGLGPNSEKGTQSQGTQRSIEAREVERRKESAIKKEKAVSVEKEHQPEGRSKYSDVHEPKDNVPSRSARLQKQTRIAEKIKPSILDRPDDEDLSSSDDHMQRHSLESEAKSKQSSVRTFRNRSKIHTQDHLDDSKQQAPATRKIAGTRMRSRIASKLRSFLDDLDDFDEAALARSRSEEFEGQPIAEKREQPRSPSPVKRRIKIEYSSSVSNTEQQTNGTRVRSKFSSSMNTPNPNVKKDKEKKDRKARYDEIPVFLY